MICQYYFGLFCFHEIVAVVRGGILCQRRSPWMSDFHSVCLSHLDVQLVNIFPDKQLESNQPRKYELPEPFCFTHCQQKAHLPPPPLTQQLVILLSNHSSST